MVLCNRPAVFECAWYDHIDRILVSERWPPGMCVLSSTIFGAGAGKIVAQGPAARSECMSAEHQRPGSFVLIVPGGVSLL